MAVSYTGSGKMQGLPFTWKSDSIMGSGGINASKFLILRTYVVSAA